MAQLQTNNKPTKNGCLINVNEKQLFIKQPTSLEIKTLYIAIMSNIQVVRNVFKINNFI